MLFFKNLNEEEYIKNKALAEEHRRKSEAHKESIRLSIRSFLMVGLCILCMVTVILAIAAWFAHNISVSATDMNILAKDILPHVNGYEIYGYLKDEDIETWTLQCLSCTGSPGEEAVTIKPFDAVLNDNTDTPIYYKIKLDSKEFENIENIISLRITIPYDENAKWQVCDDPNAESYYFSSLIRAFCLTSTNLKTTDLTAAYQTLTDMFRDQNPQSVTEKDKARFIQVGSNPPYQYRTDNENKEMCIDIPASDLTISANNEIFLYIKIDYDPDLVKEFLGQNNNGETDINYTNTRINMGNFIWDIGKIRFKIVFKQ